MFYWIFAILYQVARALSGIGSNWLGSSEVDENYHRGSGISGSVVPTSTIETEPTEFETQVFETGSSGASETAEINEDWTVDVESQGIETGSSRASETTDVNDDWADVTTDLDTNVATESQSLDDEMEITEEYQDFTGSPYHRPYIVLRGFPLRAVHPDSEIASFLRLRAAIRGFTISGKWNF
ncbi:hypothetical protein AAF712_009341 [Marasmius tenuissimus]|uniref:Uncharacterized protein n=1 Tax=Marasmius tenuissimus TaxID=585030 RepID=A0ABR2ZRJ5_9AGAR